MDIYNTRSCNINANNDSNKRVYRGEEKTTNENKEEKQEKIDKLVICLSCYYKRKK